MFAIVKFLDENDAPGIVCSHWIDKDNDTCLYPNVRTNEARDKILRKQDNPNSDWSSCRIKVLKRYNTFSAALQQLSKAEETSNLESDEDAFFSKKRPHKRTHLSYPGEESDEDSVSLIQQKRPKKGKDAAIPYPVPPNEQRRQERNIPREECLFPPREECLFPPREESPPLHFSQQSTQIEVHTPYTSKPSASFSNLNVINGRLDAWMADVSHKIQRLEGKMDSIINLLSERRQVPDHTVEDISVLGALPATDDESFVELNRKISENNFGYLLIKVFASVGGRDLRNNVHNMLRKVMCDEVAELYSLSGKATSRNSAKKPFVATQVYRSIISACRRVFKDEATEVQIKDAIADWLHQAKVRRNRRMQRFDRKNGEDI